MADTSKGVTEVQALTSEELAEIERDLLEANPGDWDTTRIKKLTSAIRQRNKRIEELEAQLKEKKQ